MSTPILPRQYIPRRGARPSPPAAPRLEPTLGPSAGIQAESSTWSNPIMEAKFAAAASIYQNWLEAEDLGPLQFVAATIAASRYDADPLWGMLIGGPGSGKTELLRSLSSIQTPPIHEVSTITVPGLLSGVSKRDRDDDAKGGLLAEIGEGPAVVVVKDWGSILSMDRHARGNLMAALREVYDGRWTRRIGEDGGMELHWHGKVGFLCGTTGAIDLHHGLMAELGERFVYFRLTNKRADRGKQAESALNNIGQFAEMRHDLSDAMAELFNPFPPLPGIGQFLSRPRREQLTALADFTSMARSAVNRDPYRRYVIENVPAPESPARLAGELAVLLGSLAAVGVEEQAAWRVVRKVAADSVPPVRAAILNALAAATRPMPLATIAAQVKPSKTTVLYSLEDLGSLGVLAKLKGHTGAADLWKLSEWSLQLYEKAGF